MLARSEQRPSGFDLTSANLTGAKFDHAQCIACDFTGATLNGASFSRHLSARSAAVERCTLQTSVLRRRLALLRSDPRNLATPVHRLTGQNPTAVAAGARLAGGLRAGAQFTTTTLTERSRSRSVTACPTGRPPAAPDGCTGGSPLRITAGVEHSAPGSTVRAAVALDACPTPTSYRVRRQRRGTKRRADLGRARGPAHLVQHREHARATTSGSRTEPCSWSAVAPEFRRCSQPYPAGTRDRDRRVAVHRRPDPASGAPVDPASGRTTTVAGSGTACTNPTATCGDGGRRPPPPRSADRWACGSSPSGDAVHRRRRPRDPRGSVLTARSRPSDPKPEAYDVVSVVGDATGNLYAADQQPRPHHPGQPRHRTRSRPWSAPGRAATTATSQHDRRRGVEINHPRSSVRGAERRRRVRRHRQPLIEAYVPSAGNVVDELGGLIPKRRPAGRQQRRGDSRRRDEVRSIRRGHGDPRRAGGRGRHRELACREIGPNPLPSTVGGTARHPAAHRSRIRRVPRV